MDNEQVNNNQPTDSDQPEQLSNVSSNNDNPLNSQVGTDSEGIRSEDPSSGTPTVLPVSLGGGSEPSPIHLNSDKKSTVRSKYLLPIVLAGALLFGGGAAAYVNVFQKSPQKLWERALSNTSEGLEKMIEIGLNDSDKGMAFDGTLEVSSPIAIDGTMEGNWYEGTGSMSAEITASGANVNVDVRSIAEDASTTPDIYARISGLSQVDTLLGGALGNEAGSIIEGVENQWFFVDKTLIDQALMSMDESETPSISQEDMKEVSANVMAVMKNRFFASDDKGVFTLQEKIGKETFEGTETYKVKVAVNKDNFSAFVTELKDAIKETKIEELLKTSDPEKSLEEALNFEELIKSINDADFSKAVAEVWLEANGGYVRNVRIYPEDGNTQSYIDFGMKYEGGNVYPLMMRLTMDEDEAKGTLSMGMNVDSSNADATMTVDADMTMSGQSFKMKMSMSLKGSNEKPTVDAPEDAVNILELLGAMQMGNMSSYEGMDLDSMEEYDYQDLDFTIPSSLDDQEL